jgi:hypothetical protein
MTATTAHQIRGLGSRWIDAEREADTETLDGETGS